MNEEWLNQHARKLKKINHWNLTRSLLKSSCSGLTIFLLSFGCIWPRRTIYQRKATSLAAETVSQTNHQRWEATPSRMTDFPTHRRSIQKPNSRWTRVSSSHFHSEDVGTLADELMGFLLCHWLGWSRIQTLESLLLFISGSPTSKV